MRMQKAEHPLISVLMGVYYQKEDLEPLKRSVHSILNQSLGDFELLICANGSSEPAVHYLEELAQKEQRLRMILLEDRVDLASKLNACLREASGRYIARMDDDDLSRPQRFAKQIKALETHSSVGFVGSNVTLWRSGMGCGERRFPEFPKVRDFYFTQPFVHPSLLFRREILDAVGGYSEAAQQVLCEDYDLLLRLYQAGYCGMNLQEPLLEYTIPVTAKGNRRMCHRWNETVTRYHRFRELGKLPAAWPYVVKPLVVGLVPSMMLEKLKNQWGIRVQ